MTNSRPSERRRHKRYPIRERVVVHCNGASTLCDMVDISIGGARLILGEIPDILTSGLLESDRFGRFNFTVRYRSEFDGNAGVEFELTVLERSALGEKLKELEPE